MATPIPQNRAAFSFDAILAATGAVASGAFAAVDGVATDSREDVRGKLFLALVGEHFDGHDHAKIAVERGAVAAIVSRDVGDVGAPCLRVEDTLAALGALARVVRRRWGGTLVTVGGSAGKTTTRSTCAAALEAVAPGRVYASRGNLNNRIGVPMVLLALDPAATHAVIEVGTNLLGEIAQLAAVCEADAALLTLVAVEHSAGLGDLDHIEQEEGDLLRGLSEAGLAIANADDERAVRQLHRSPAGAQVTYGTTRGSDYRVAARRSLGVRGTHVEIERPGSDAPVIVDCSLLGEPGALAVAAAVALADGLAQAPLPASALGHALSSATLGEPGRLVAIELADGTLLLDDSYNSNPGSVYASLATARELSAERGARLVLVLGEMRELGAASAEEHRRVGERLAGSGASELIAVAGDAALMLPGAQAAGLHARFAADAHAAASLALECVRPGDVVLVKASRGVHAERVAQALVAAHGGAT